MPQVQFSAFTSPTFEGFESVAGLGSGGDLGPGFLLPGTSFRFSSGASITSNPRGETVIGNFSRGDAGWGMLNSGYIEAALSGSAYLGANNDTGFELTLDNDALRVGGWFVAAPGGITIRAYDRFNVLVETATFGSATATTWGSNFIGLQQTNGIKKIQASGAYIALDNFMFEGGSTPPPTPPAASITSASRAEGNSGSSALNFSVNLNKPSAQAVTLAYATANGSAQAGSDYAAASGTLTFAPGEVSKTIAVSVLGDAVFEPDETFTVTLSNATAATIATATATGTIANDDIPPTTITIAGVTRAEGNSGSSPSNFVVSLSGASTVPISVSYATSNGTATAGQDYTASAGT
ncbi:MAG TPA: Calx-beta domain-containing protein, partial [Thermosynechococcaceae cyanobacterium]